MLKTRLIVSAVLIIILLAAALWLPSVCLAVLVAVIAALGAYELMHATEEAKNQRLYLWTAISAAAVPIGVFLGRGELTVRLALLFLMLSLFAEAVFSYGRDGQVPFSAVATGFVAGLVVPMCLSALVSMKLLENGSVIIIMAFVITAVSDTFGYIVGMICGKHKGLMKASPNKSLEGFAGSFAGGIIGILIFGLIIDKLVGMQVNYGLLILYAVPGNITTQLGDLAFSVVKRQHGIKDYGKLIPGHGGVLDRLDSMIFTGPLVYLLFTAFPAF